MQRHILIIDDHDDLASALKAEFGRAGYSVAILINRKQALAVENIDDFDVVITDLDVKPHVADLPANGNGTNCLPAEPDGKAGEHIKAFKICATRFHRDEFDEESLKQIVETTLNYKTKFVDKWDLVQSLHEHIEFELPSSISVMHSVLEYLMKRVEKLGVIKAEQSNLFVALDEAFVNAVKHGNKFDAKKLVRIAADVSRQEARFTIEDQGEGFDVNSIPDPLDPTNLFKASGRGVLFIYNIMDEVKYNERGNRLTMVKKSETSKDDPQLA
ncbi:MAG: ATP-binding protein [Acidobacteria bacterium]|nr:ATP-binding protein [Acidobacteriota bacterium]